MTTVEHEEDAAAGSAPAAVSVRGRPIHRTPLAWLPWAALAVAGAIALAMIVVAVAAAGTEDDPTPSGDRSSAPTTTAAPTATSTTAPAASTAPEPPAASAPTATLTAADGRSLLPLPADGLQAVAGQPVEGHGAVVQSVVADEGFWVGSDETNRIFVHGSPSGSGESPYKAEAGQHVDLAGTVTALGGNSPSTLGVGRSEGADQLRSQGYYIELTSVALSA